VKQKERPEPKTRAKRARGQRAPKCPICGKPTVQAYQPFCSKGCADTDLSRWLEGKYIVPGESAATDGEPED
jgi:endogenous inhibitor of DNA gyrase (YacG/DUF329 family)